MCACTADLTFATAHFSKVQMRQRFLDCTLALGLVCWWTSSVAAEEVGVSFVGNLTSILPAYGFPPPLKSFDGNDVRAKFIYRTDSVGASLGGCDCAGYRQRIFNGFSVKFGAHGEFEVRADEYYVEVINDYGQTGSDFFQVVFSSNYQPVNGSPLYVNGGQETTGAMFILLRNEDGTAINGSTLPTPAVLEAFEERYIFLNESFADKLPNGSDPFNLGGSLEPPELLDLVFGDYDVDGAVDGSDFLTWQRSLGDSSISPADGNRDGLVDEDDLAIWREGFGEYAGDSASTPVQVPEPLGFTIAAILLAATSVARIERSGSSSSR